jgi:hypothetical protein
MTKKEVRVVILVAVIAVVGFLAYRNLSEPKNVLPKNTEIESEPLTSEPMTIEDKTGNKVEDKEKQMSDRQILVTKDERVKHSVPLGEILSGGPPKDGIPSIDDPNFTSVPEADEWLDDKETGTGLCVGDDCRFYPYQILVWHEMVNDTVGQEPVLVTYCPLCFTGIVFERILNNEVVEFGTSGKLWQSNLVMYNRTTPDSSQLSDLEKQLGLESKDESLWSQVLGEAIVGEHTGTKLKIISSDVVRYSEWKKLHPNTVVLSKDTGASRTYGYDPYGDYYTSNEVSFGASFNDDRLHPKEFVLGININGKFKAYHSLAIKVGETGDGFNGETIIIVKNDGGEVRMFKGDNRESLPYVGGFWFSWLSVHPDTELFK